MLHTLARRCLQRHRAMSLGLGLCQCLFPALAWSQQQQDLAPVQVTFNHPERYTDAGDGPGELRDTVQALEASLRMLGRQALAAMPPGQRLRIDITDIDLAGRIPLATGQPNPPRLLTGAADWPRIDLHYALLTPDGQVQQSGHVSLDDKAYLQHSLAASGSDRLRYEKRLLAQWIERQFGPRRGGGDKR